MFDAQARLIKHLKDIKSCALINLLDAFLTKLISMLRESQPLQKHRHLDCGPLCYLTFGREAFLIVEVGDGTLHFVGWFAKR